MKLKSLEINGFKSFAEKTVIEFMPGMTGVVGPNGSGKSNIIEAIRWVMGEQSAKGLRGDKMSDVIFGGSKNRNAMSRASVTMNIDNSDHFLKSDFKELQITRRLYRNGDSEYLINGVKSRLKDITDLFVDTGLGRESFSIINQGKVESIFSAKPEERRAIIEDVAGVLKYKQNKQRTENELATTAENIARVNDIISEIEGRLEPLKKQASDAQVFREVQSQYEELNLIKNIRMQNQLHDQIEQLNVSLMQNKEQLSVTENGLNEIVKEQEEKQNLSRELENQVRQLTAEIERQTAEVERTRGENNLQHNQLQNLQERKDRLTTQQGDLNQQVEKLNQEVKDATENRDQQHSQLTVVQTQVDELFNQLKDLNQLSGRDNLDRLKDDYFQQKVEKTNLENSVANQEKDNQRLNERIIRLQKSIEDLEASQKERQNEMANFGNQDVVTNSFETVQNKSESIRKELDEDNQTLETINTNHLELLNTFNQHKARLESLQNSTENADYYQGVRNVLAAKNQLQGILGTVAELITVDPKHVVAIETALGAGLQNVVVKDERAAKDAVAYLSGRHLGRATFLPITNMQARSIPADVLNKIKSMNGFVGVGNTLVKIKSEYQVILDNLLGVTLVAEDIDAALDISRAINRRFSIVTLDGHIARAGGAVTGGSNNNSAGILQKFTEIDQLRQSVEKEEQTLSESRNRITELQNAIKLKEDRYQTVRNELFEQKEQVQLSLGGKKMIEDSLANIKENIQANQLEIQTSQSEIKQNDEMIAEYQAKIHQLEKTLSSSEEEISKLEANVATNQEAESKQNDELTTRREKLAEVRVLSDTADERLENKQAQLRAVQESFESLQNEIANIEKEIDEIRKQNIQEDNLSELDESLSQNIEKRNGLNEELNTVREALKLIADRNTHLQETFREQNDSKNKLEVKLSSQNTRLEQVINTLEQIEYDPNQEIDLLEQRDIEEINQVVSTLKQQLAGFTHVNLGAIDELEEVSERYDFLTKQRDDLIKSSEDLKTAIAALDKEVIEKFEATFNSVASKFEQTFKRLFSGGQASLKLSDPKDLLHTGIEIIVQPPGKKARNLSLLSGGEKALTAIALLLAILLVNPVPFAILDETEAALDESNVDNFGRFIAEFGKQTQFIVITHRKPTMKYANILYGVTMQEPGVSTMLSVTLDDIKDDAK